MTVPAVFAQQPSIRQLPDVGVCDIPAGPGIVCEQFGQAVGDAANSAIDGLVDALLDGFARGIRLVMGWWTDLPAPELTGPGGEPGTALSAIRDYSAELQTVLLTAGLLFAAARLALAKRGALAAEAQESFLMLARAVFTAMAFAAMIALGTRSGDAFANWVIFEATDGDWKSAVARVTAFDEPINNYMGTGLLLIVGLLGLISTLVQLVMLVTRHALLILVVAVIPLAAAASGTGPGSQSYKRLLAWSLALVLYKPVGALVYAIAFTVIGTEEQQDPQQILLGLILLVMAVAVLPALIRLVAPAVATLGGGGGASAVLAGGMAGVAMGSAGDRSNARKVSEGENSPGASASGGSGGGGPTAGGSSPGGGGRPLGGGSGPGNGAGGGGGSSGASGSPRSTGAAGKSGAGVGAGTSSGAATGAGAAAGAGAGAGGAAAGGAAGGVGMAAQAVKAAGTQAVSAVEAQTRDAAEGGWNPDRLQPGEVRR